MPPRTKAVLFDALGTLVALEPPFEALAAALGGEVPVSRVERAMGAEMDYYRAHSHEGGDPASLAELRRRSAAVLSDELGREVDVETMMSAIRFRAYADAIPALAELRRRGLRTVCVSNWDCTLPTVLAELELGEVLDGVVVSAVAGARKPNPEIFETALAIAGCEADEAVHVGDSVAEDVEGALAAGIRVLHLRRDEDGDEAPAEVAAISSLLDIRDHLAA